MKRVTEMTSRTLGFGLLAASLLLAQNALAVGTPAGTTVENTASATYSVNGIAQAPVDSNLATFLVDERVDFVLTETDSAATIVTPNQTLAVTEFVLTNQGNVVQDFNLAVANLPNGTSVHGNADSDDIDDPVVIYLDDGDNSFSAASDTVITFVNNLSEVPGSNTARLFVVSTIPADAINGGFINVELTATAHDGGTGGLGPVTTDDATDADDPTLVQVVFADASFDGVESAQDGYAVQSAALLVTKASDVLADEFGSNAGEGK